jgi:hypothetical protein
VTPDGSRSRSFLEAGVWWPSISATTETTPSELLKQASEFIVTAREALAAGRLGPAVETALAARELAVTAMTTLQNTTHKGRNTHGARQAWLNRYTHLGNGSQDWYKAMRRLLEARPFARYGDPEGSPLSSKKRADRLPRPHRWPD